MSSPNAAGVPPTQDPASKAEADAAASKIQSLTRQRAAKAELERRRADKLLEVSSDAKK